MAKLIDSLSHGVPAALREIISLGRTLKKCAPDVLAYFDRPGTSNGPTEAINGRLEHLRGSALGFRNLTNYIARSRAICDRLGPGTINVFFERWMSRLPSLPSRSLHKTPFGLALALAESRVSSLGGR